MRVKNEYLGEKRLLTINEASAYLGQGRSKTRQYMSEIGAVRRFGSRVLFDKVIIDKALDSLSQ